MCIHTKQVREEGYDSTSLGRWDRVNAGFREGAFSAAR
jgi:hypothetical protein